MQKLVCDVCESEAHVEKTEVFIGVEELIMNAKPMGKHLCKQHKIEALEKMINKLQDIEL